MEKARTKKKSVLDVIVHISRAIIYIAILVLTYILKYDWFVPAIMFTVTFILIASILPKVVEPKCVALERALAILEVIVVPVVLLGHYDLFFNFEMGTGVIFLAMLNIAMFVADCFEYNKA